MTKTQKKERKIIEEDIEGLIERDGKERNRQKRYVNTEY